MNDTAHSTLPIRALTIRWQFPHIKHGNEAFLSGIRIHISQGRCNSQSLPLGMLMYVYERRRYRNISRTSTQKQTRIILSGSEHLLITNYYNYVWGPPLLALVLSHQYS